MAKQTIDNGETGLVVRGKLNDNFTELYAFGTWVDYVPTLTGYSVLPSVNVSRYCVLGKMCIYEFHSVTAGTSNATTKTITLPFNAKHTGNIAFSQLINNGILSATPGLCTPNAASSNICNLYRDLSGLAWTASGTCHVIRFTLIFEVE